VNVITALEIQKRDKERVNVFLDNEYAFSLSLLNAAPLRKGQSLSDQEINQLKTQDQLQRAVDQAARFLSYRPRSSTEIRDNLKKRFDAVTIDAAIEKLKDLNYLDDRAFARYWVENRDTFKPRSTSALRYELRQKGLEPTVIDEVLNDFDNQSSAYRAAEAKARRFRNLTMTDFRNKMSSYLQRRGFDYGTIRETLAQLEDDLVEQDADFFAPDSDHPDR
jgi:regulatory protein